MRLSIFYELKLNNQMVIYNSEANKPRTLESILIELKEVKQQISDLKNNMLYITGLYSNNLDEAQKDGCYYFDKNSKNKPNTDYGTVFTMVSNGIEGNNIDKWVNHLAFGTNYVICYRQKVNQNVWSNWIQIQSK